MYTSGLVVTLSDNPAEADAAWTELATAGPFTLGVAYGTGRAATMEVADPNSALAWHDWVAARPGVESVEVVFVHWDDEEEEVPHACD